MPTAKKTTRKVSPSKKATTKKAPKAQQKPHVIAMAYGFVILALIFLGLAVLQTLA